MQNVDRGITGSSLAGSAILLEIGAEYGIIETLQNSPVLDAATVSRSSGIKEPVIAAYLDSLSKAGIIEELDKKPTATYRTSNHFDELINEVGYLSWALRACAPLINNAKEFSENNEEAQLKYPRSGGLVARTSKWMGEKSFYPQPENAIVAMAPKKIVDLGSGSGGFLIRMLRKIPGSTGIGIDLSPSATEQAVHAASEAGMSDRLQFVTAPIQILVTDPSLIRDADIIHAGFVMHDLLPAEEETLDALLRACCANAIKGTLIIVDAIPVAQSNWEKPFAAAFNHLHNHFMSRKLLSEKEWTEKLTRAGFSNVRIEILDHPGGRMLMASR
ncbi:MULTISPECIES: class I SAM-dependent methyltransferase [Variovorax]|jgi:SAM-dependent methyltransferase|uniref:class I SAM-dependent methyltransferase n=1 Tax=Variovorax TaxID=34072 RepID=UPI00086F6CE3|nr:MULTISPECIES: class I SAM-dependent methyltransferase [Variovorax]MBN8752334.1 methyltransferase domain-containing protein [Variovorax sp.]ODU18189.1 MAG: methyltransferase [Variovorax sp. SCN 67-85]ODV26788.1 MAG: methyltransferase [Variovorax sp. SCN 67-20]OJZ08878.1 MAG: methyltransferase [Variovorax sp. 67-131]UKI11340.1 methyltransferase domain-containing protein [Variovorax paradoxus]